MIFVCRKCEDEVEIDFDLRDPNDCTAWCETCNDYATGFDPTEYAADYLSGLADDAMDRIYDDYWND